MTDGEGAPPKNTDPGDWLVLGRKFVPVIVTEFKQDETESMPDEGETPVTWDA